MSEKQKAIHNAYCDYQIAKAKAPTKIYTVRQPQKSGVKTYNISKAILARELAPLFGI